MFKGKVTIVTGASSGIGKECAIQFSKHGSNLVLVGRNQERLLETETECKKNGVETLIVQADVADMESCKRIIDETIKRFHKIDILVNNAGISMRAMFKDLDLDVMHRVMNTNFWGSVYTTKFALPYLLESRGSIIGVLSTAGFRGLPGRTAYSASKFALNGFYEVLRTEHYKDGLHILIAAPGFVATNIRKTALVSNGTEQGTSPRNESKMMTAREVAQRIVRATYRKKNYLFLSTLGKATIWVNKFFPVFLDKLVYRHFAKEVDSPFK